MAKSPVGGSRAYLKGRIGSDVYSLGKTSKGQRQQIVRSLAEQVSNPRTSTQMAGRMIMSTVMQAAKFLNPIIDHSFDGLPVGQPSISEFIRRSYAAIKDKSGQYNEYQEKGCKPNPYVVSAGSIKWTSDVAYRQNVNDDSTAFGQWGVNITMDIDHMTVGALRALLHRSSEDDYITCINLANSDNGKGFVRFRVNPALADATAITTDMTNLFVTEAVGLTPRVVINKNAEAEVPAEIFIAAGNPNDNDGKGAIWSQKVGSTWKHSACTLGAYSDETNWDEALATYPVGSEQFLNGGDL